MEKMQTFAVVDGRRFGPLNEKDVSRLRHKKGVEIERVELSPEEIERQKAEGRRQKATRSPLLHGLGSGF